MPNSLARDEAGTGGHKGKRRTATRSVDHGGKAEEAEDEKRGGAKKQTGGVGEHPRVEREARKREPEGNSVRMRESGRGR